MSRGGKRPGAGRKPKFKAPVGRPSKYDPSFCEAVVKVMGEGFSLGAFAGKIGVCRSTINEWMEQHPEFSVAVNRGKCSRLVHWEEAAMRVAKSGGTGGSATIIVFGLKNMGSDDWADKSHQEITGKNGGPIETKELSARELIRSRISGIASRSGPAGDAEKSK